MRKGKDESGSGFEQLHWRLSEHMRRKLRSGETTERGLARLTGISQSHLHHVLKEMRVFSPQMADRAMERLGIDVWTLLGEDEGVGAWETAPLVRESIGPGRRFPDLGKWRGRVPFPRSDLARMQWPVAVRLEADPAVRHLFRGGDMALIEPLDLASAAAAGYCAIDEREGSLIRWMERHGERLVLRAEPGGAETGSMAVTDGTILEVARARVVWIGHYLE
jgi:hypothetical protein